MDELGGRLVSTSTERTGDLARGSMWRHGVALAVLLVPLDALLSMRPFVEPAGYMDFAARRVLLGIPNFFDVLSSFLFLAVGIAGLRVSLRLRPPGSLAAWVVFSAGIALVGLGSAYFHWNPTRDTIVWDRVPMVLGFMGFLAAILSDYVSARLVRLLLPMVLIGIASVVYGHQFEDLRFYSWIQALPLLGIVAIFLYPARYTCRGYLLAAIGCYGLAKLAEIYDLPIYSFTSGIVSGHTLKHVLSAFGVYLLLPMLKRRTPIGVAPGTSPTR